MQKHPLFKWKIKILIILLFLQLLKLEKQKCTQNLDFPIAIMFFGHFNIMAKYTCYCKNAQNGKHFDDLKSLGYIFLKVGENKVPLEFSFTKKK